MTCINCNFEIDDSSKFCKNCGSKLDKKIEFKDNNSTENTFENTFLPTSGNAKIKIFLYFLMLVILLPVFLISSIPLIQTIASIYIMKSDRTFVSIENLQSVLRKTLLIVGVIGTLIGLLCYHIFGNPVNGSTSDPREMEFYFGIIILGSFGVPLLTNLFTKIFDKLFFQPMFKHKEWILKHGIFYSPYKDSK